MQGNQQFRRSYEHRVHEAILRVLPQSRRSYLSLGLRLRPQKAELKPDD